jgi:hypothetical protein
MMTNYDIYTAEAAAKNEQERNFFFFFFFFFFLSRFSWCSRAAAAGETDDRTNKYAAGGGRQVLVMGRERARDEMGGITMTVCVHAVWFRMMGELFEQNYLSRTYTFQSAMFDRPSVV